MPTDKRIDATYKHQDLSLDEDSMTATVMGPDGPLGEVTFEWAVCPTCEGTGTHVNPSIDAHGISPEEFAEDPQFEEDYFSGSYDQPCNECGGRRVVPRLDPQGDEEEAIARRRREIKEAVRQTREMQRAERRMAMGRGMR